jgi:iron complex outermembrane receptor protein
MDAALRTIAVATGAATQIYPETRGSATDHAVTPTAIFKYTFSPDANVYAKYARGFKSGGFNLGASAAFALTHYDPEFMDSYEVGTKLRFFDGRLRLNAAGYINNVKDLQVSVIRNSGIITASVVDNAAGATFKGLELEAQWSPVERLRLKGSLGYTDPSYHNYVDAGVNVSDTRVIPYVSKLTASAGVDATLVQAPWGQVRATIDYSHADDYYTLAFDRRPRSAAIRSSAQPTRAQSIDLVDATLQLTDTKVALGSLEISLWSHNLFNVHRFVGGVDFGAAFGNLTTGFYNTPRTYGADVTLKF